MDSESEMIPCLDFRKNGGVTLEEGSEGWKAMSKKVREACERHGCFFLMCDEISSDLREEVFTGMKTLFDFPEEVKRKHISPKTYNTGFEKGTRITPLCESFRIDDSVRPTSAHAFTTIMWPQGNPSFCEALYSMSSKMMELCSFILKMILEDYGLPQHYTLDVEDMKSTSDTRLTKYEIPENNKNSDIAMITHTDRGTITILCDNDVQGLQVLTKTGKLIDINIPSNGFVVIVGDILKAWSNGRLEAARHRVVKRGNKARYSFVVFALPKENMVIKVPPELVDDKMHPLRYRPFNCKEYLQYRVSIPREDNALEPFAGLIC